MTYFIKENDQWVEFTNQPINGIQWSSNIFGSGKTPEEFEEMGIYQATKPATPADKLVQSFTIIDVDGRPEYSMVYMDKPPLTPVDCSITMRQLRLGLKEFGGKRANYIQTLIDDIADPATQDAAQIWYDETTEVLWDNPMTQALIAMTDFTVEQAAGMWMAAYNTLPR